MYCKLCNKFFKVNRTFKEILINKKLFLCPNCIDRYRLRLKHIVVPLDKYNINFYILYEKMTFKYLHVYINEYSKIIRELTKRGRHVFIIDEFDELKIPIYEQIVKILGEDVTFVSFLLKTL